MSMDTHGEASEIGMDAICRFSGHLAHDINNLLTPIIACGQMLRDGIKKDDPLFFCADQVAEAGERFLALSRKLQVIGSRRSSGHVLAIASLIPEGVKSAALPTGTPITVAEPYLDRPDVVGGQVKLDMEQFIFLTGELVRNAADAMPQGGVITVDVAVVGDVPDAPFASPAGWVVLSVADQGTGMTPDVMARIYEPYFSTHGQERDKGLGLTLVYGIVRRAGGFIRCESQPGQGAVFRVYFPGHPSS
ncbi:MAG TPA: ATP-binding protein [Kiritimatiellia bacterium]|nr:ATP-binding protein [Kiritimatiellia bacterium]